LSAAKFHTIAGRLMVAMVAVALNVPSEILLDLKVTEKAFSSYARRYLALDLYKNKGISLGYCAELAEMAKEDFMLFLGNNRISIFDFND